MSKIASLNISYSRVQTVEKLPDHLRKLGKHKTGRSCLYVNKLEDVDMGVLRQLVDDTVKRQGKSRA